MRCGINNKRTGGRQLHTRGRGRGRRGGGCGAGHVNNRNSRRQLINCSLERTLKNLSPIKNTLKGHKFQLLQPPPFLGTEYVAYATVIVARAQPSLSTIDDNQCLHCIIIIGINE